ncbi:MAG: methyltransferase domain-containing protein [Ectothiorhodospiraceae bacterium]|nr:methyltransferase domain-containing protein [Ectothiorhodospiraceae bacterium]MCH8505285.1 methyltransferase domain-containing protein [Ectothiorhodospiraceae bacterium]
MVAILGYSRQQITQAVQQMYTAVARNPDSDFHFPVGSDACSLLGYPREELEQLPPAARDAFAGVGYPHRCKAVRAGDTVLDLGAGAGVDSVLASQQVGDEGHVIALDLTPAMTHRLQRCAEQAGCSNVSVLQGSAEALPLADASIDSVTSNGVLNLVPDKRKAVRELFRVLRPGGRVQIADVVIRRPVTVDCHSDPRLWVECVVGATVDDNFLALFREAGFEDVELVHSHDYFAHSPSRQTREVAEGFGARSIELRMRRGEANPPLPIRLWRRWNPRRLFTSLWRRGWLGCAALIAALLACYGTLAAVALLAMMGIGTMLNETLWAGSIALLSVAATATIVAGLRHHGNPGPPICSVIGAALIVYTMTIDYSRVIEGAGFVLLAAAVVWDILVRRGTQRKLLGLDSSPGH